MIHSIFFGFFAFTLVICRKVTYQECVSLFELVDADDTEKLNQFLKNTNHFNSKSMNLVGCKRDGFNPWHVAVDGGPLPLIQLLIDACDNESLQSVDSLKYNAIHFAARTGHPDLLEVLLLCGVDANAIAGDSCTALAIAATNGHTTFVQILLSVTTPATLNYQMNEKYQRKNALFAACINGYSEIATLLLEKGANPYLKNSFGQCVLESTILHYPYASTINVLMSYLKVNPGDILMFVECVTRAISAAIATRKHILATRLDDLLQAHDITHDILIPKDASIPDEISQSLVDLYPINRSLLGYDKIMEEEEEKK